MKKAPLLILTMMLVIFYSCSSSKEIAQSPTVQINSDLSRWVLVDSVSSSMVKRSNIDSKTRDLNLQQLRDQLDKDKNASDFGESLYYMLHGLFQK